MISEKDDCVLTHTDSSDDRSCDNRKGHASCNGKVSTVM